MLVRIYWSLWGLIGLAALVVFAIGNFAMFSAVVFGFIAFGMTFMGMMGVLPVVVSHPHVEKPAKAPKVAAPIRHEAPATGFHIFKSA
jgi:hypothetical protein